MKLETLKNLPPWEWPPGAAKTIKSVFSRTKSSEAELVDAVELGGDLTVLDDELARTILGVATDAGRPESLRARAAIALGPALENADMMEFDDPELAPISEPVFHAVQDGLRKLHQDASAPKLVRRRALEAAVRAPQEWHAEAVRTAFATGDHEWRLTAVFCMRFIEGFEPQILAALGEQQGDLFREAVEAAGSHDLAAAWPVVRRLLHATKDRKTLLAAISAAGGFSAPEAEERLVELSESQDEEVAEAAEEALSMRLPADGEEGAGDEDDDDE